MTQRDRDRLVVLKKAQKKLIRPAQAAAELGISVRQVKRLLQRRRQEGDRAVVHGLRGRPSGRKLTPAVSFHTAELNLTWDFDQAPVVKSKHGAS